MTINCTSSNRLQGFDPVVEAAYLLNGQDIADLSYESRVINYLAEVAKHCIEPQWAVTALSRRIAPPIRRIDGASFRKLSVVHAENCKDSGVPFNTTELALIKKVTLRSLKKLEREIPLGLIDGKGVVDTETLTNHLSPVELIVWPKTVDGDLDVSTEALDASENKLASLITKAKKLYRDKTILKFTVDEDGRHRSDPNVFGTQTGRDKPIGSALIYLPKHRRSLIQPNSGNVIAVIDYQCQEPTIAAALSGSRELYNICYQADLYQSLLDRGKFNGLQRKQAKRLLIAYLYGISIAGISHKFNVAYELANQWSFELSEILGNVENWLDMRVNQAFKDGEIFSLDWRMTVKTSSSRLSIRNWPIQAAGADILRRACALLADENISVIYRLHDAVMIEIPICDYERTIKRAEQLMQVSSADVLNGYQLKTSVEAIYWPASRPSI